MLDLLRKSFVLAGNERPGRWLAVVAGAVVVSGLEMVSAVLVYLLLALVADPGAQLQLPIVGDVRGVFGGVDQQTFLLGAAAVLGAFFLVRAVLQSAFLYVKHRLAQSAAARLSADLAEGYLRLPYTVHLRRSSAELLRNAHQTAEQAAPHFFLPAIQVIADALVITGLLAVMLVVAPAGTGLAVAVVGGAAALLLLVVQPRLKRLGGRVQELRKRTLGALQQSLYGIRDLQVSGAEGYFGERYRRSRRRLGRAMYLRGFVSELPRQVIETTLMVVLLALFALSVVRAEAPDQLLSTLGMFAYAGIRILPSLQRIVGGLNNLKFAGPAIEQVHDDLVLIARHARHDDDGPDLRFERELRLTDVDFSYGGERLPAITGADLTIAPGEMVGVCGPTGGGKTTLTDLISGILPPTTGSVTVDGADVDTHRGAWFRKLGIVPQSVFLVDDTLRRNIAFGLADTDIDETRVREAVRLAQLEDDVASLPHGLDTHVGERGVRFSGGERQRVAIARALYRRPEVLVFDEGTASLDNATEARLMAAIQHLRGTHTIVLVAHRLSTIRGCDRIVYVEDGRIAAVGTFEALLATSEGFRSLAEGSVAPD